MSTKIKKNKTLYRLEHIHKTDGYIQRLYIGLFDSRNKIKETIEDLILQLGFKLHSKEAFHIIEVEVDKTYWDKGFESKNGEDIELM